MPHKCSYPYSNLKELYSTFNYPPSHIWNWDENRMHAYKSGGATVLTKLGSKFVHTIEPDHREHFSIISCINVARGKISNFYILKGTYFLQDYIKNSELDVIMVTQPNTWMTKWLFESWILHFIGILKKTTKFDITKYAVANFIRTQFACQIRSSYNCHEFKFKDHLLIYLYMSSTQVRPTKDQELESKKW